MARLEDVEVNGVLLGCRAIRALCHRSSICAEFRPESFDHGERSSLIEVSRF